MEMKRLFTLLFALLLCVGLVGCTGYKDSMQIAATTLPVYEFTNALCQGTDLNVSRVISENVSCLHDYTLRVRQMQAVEAADVVVISGAGLEEFMSDVLLNAGRTIDASGQIELMCAAEPHSHEHAHNHEQDPHIWLSPFNARQMARNICQGLTEIYPQYADIFASNAAKLDNQFDELIAYGEKELKNLYCREIITFHDGFGYLSEAFNLTILRAMEEESGSEASASELIHLVQLVQHHGLTAIFTEKNGSTAAAEVICAETGVKIFTLDMAISSNSYFEAMYNNIDTLKEALG